MGWGHWKVELRHERANPAVSTEVAAPLVLTSPSSGDLKVSRLSLLGIRLADIPDETPDRGILCIPFQGYYVIVPVALKVTNQPDFLAFGELENRAREMITIFYDGLFKGEMITGQDIITKLDTPVDLIPMTETEEEAEQAKSKLSPRWLRSLSTVFLYLAMGAFVVSFLAAKAADRMYTVPLEQGRIAAPMVPHFAPADGFMDAIFVEPGQYVEVGDTLVRLVDPNLEVEILDLRDRIARKEDYVRRLEVRLDDIMRVEAPSLYQRVMQLEDAIASHPAEDFLADRDLDDVDMALRLVHSEEELLRKFGPETFTRMFETKEAMQEEQENIWALERRIKESRDHSLGLNIAAVESGIIGSIDIHKNQFVVRGSEIITIESDAQRFGLGFVPHDLEKSIYIGMNATMIVGTSKGPVEIPSTVTGFEDHNTHNMFMEDGLLARLSPRDLTVAEARELLIPGSPIQLQIDLDRFSLGDVFGSSDEL